MSKQVLDMIIFLKVGSYVALNRFDAPNFFFGDPLPFTHRLSVPVACTELDSWRYPAASVPHRTNIWLYGY